MDVVYTVYVDRILVFGCLVQFMLLDLTNREFNRSAPWWRVIFASFLSGLVLLLPFKAPGSFYLKQAVFNGMGTLFALCFVFQINSFLCFKNVLLQYIKYLVLLGGTSGLVLKGLKTLSVSQGYMLWIAGGLCGVYLTCICLNKNHTEKSLYKATLKQGDRQIKTVAFLDTGNHLVEPISGRPVCVIDADIWEALFVDNCSDVSKDGSSLRFRVIPYHSVGKRRGILRGYLLDELILCQEGPGLRLQKVYVAVCNQQLTSRNNGDIKLLIHPGLLCKKGIPDHIKYNQERTGEHDFTSCNTGETTF